MSSPTIKLKALHYFDGDNDNYWYIKTTLSNKELEDIVTVARIIMNRVDRPASDSELIKDLAHGKSDYKDEKWLKRYLKNLVIDPNYEDGIIVDIVEY